MSGGTLSADGDPYAHYQRWKGWRKPFVFGAEDAAYFRKEFRRVAFRNARVLEIGFGEGRFLSWAMKQGAKVCGTEQIPAMANAARVAGVEVLPPQLSELLPIHKGAFDLIVALDVAEHWPLRELIENLVVLENLLKPGGRLVLRFPNGQSPFGLSAQYGDPTHKTPLSRELLEGLLVNSGIRVVRYGPQARVLGPNPLKWPIRSVRYSCRIIVNLILNFVYAKNIPWDAVVTLVLERPTRGKP